MFHLGQTGDLFAVRLHSLGKQLLIYIYSNRTAIVDYGARYRSGRWHDQWQPAATVSRAARYADIARPGDSPTNPVTAQSRVTPPVNLTVPSGRGAYHEREENSKTESCPEKLNRPHEA